MLCCLQVVRSALYLGVLDSGVDGRVGAGFRDLGDAGGDGVEVVINDRETTNGDGEDIRKFLQSKFDPFFAVESRVAVVDRCFAEQEGAADATADAVIPARDGYVDEL
jgi:hypothetical protein